jgi:hypothetical protein
MNEREATEVYLNPLQKRTGVVEFFRSRPRWSSTRVRRVTPSLNQEWCLGAALR